MLRVGDTLRTIREGRGLRLTTTDDYLPGAVGEQASGRGLYLDGFENQLVASGLLAESSWPVVISCS